MSSITSSSYPVVTVSKSGDQFAIVQNGQLKKLTRDGLQAFIESLTATTLIALTDTPGSYVGQQGQGLVVNATEDGMEFAPTVSSNLLALTDTPSSYGGQANKILAVNSAETAVEFISNTFIGHQDTPANYTGNALNTVRVNSAETALEFVTPGLANGTGWASYIDTQYPDSGTTFTVPAATDTALPNNSGTVLDMQKPTDVTEFYDGTVITGRNGDSLDIMLYFKAVPSVASQYLDVWIDIGGSVGELYRQTFSFPKGAGTSRGILYSLSSAYTLDTWEANGGTVYVRSDASLQIYDINYNFDRSHKAI